ncbi:hypothetical protein BGZ83_005958 [Gryganskiella cystojenkinii]|nr:hypothetical protein BGZ83_005958 [Gryganskiella cystojenkinii]
MAPLPSSIPPAVTEEDEVWAELYRIQDPQTLKEKFYEQHQHMRAQLDLAGRFGLSLQQDVEQLQDAQVHSYAQIQSLQGENTFLKNRASHAMDLSSQLSGSEHEVQTLTTHNESLQRELDGCRKDLKSFRRELDSLVDQMTDMGTEVLDAKTKVSVYSRRLTEVEQELNATKELNVDLQVQLQNAFDKQKQSQSSTAQVVKNIQSDLGKVLSDSGTIRSTLEELENRQVKCEDKVVEMITNTKEYAQLLEEAQETIQTLRTESDMEGRGWQHSPTSANWSYQARKSSGQLSTLSLEGDRQEFSLHELDPMVGWDRDHDIGGNSSGGTQSLGMELGLGMSDSADEWDRSQNTLETQPKDSAISSPPSTPVSYLCSAAHSKHLTPATSPLAPSVLRNGKGPEPILRPPPQQQQPQQQPPPVQKQQQPTPPMIHVPRKLSAASVSLTSELQQRLEEHNILQTVLASPLSTATGSSRPPWNPSVALENILPTPVLHQQQYNQRSRSNSRAASVSSRSSSRSLSRANLLQIASPSSSSFRNGSSSSSTSSVTQQLLQQQQHHLQTHGMMPSPQTSPHSMANSSSLMDAIAAQQGRPLHTSHSNNAVHNKQSGRSNGSRPRSRTTATTVERNPNPGLKSLLTNSISSSDLSDVITKTKTNRAQGNSSPTPNRSSTARASSSSSANYQSATNSSVNRARGGSMASHRGSGSNSPVTAVDKTKTVQRSRTSSTTSLSTQQQQQPRRSTPKTKVAPGSPSPSPSPMRGGGGGPTKETGNVVKGDVPAKPTSLLSPSLSPNPNLKGITDMPSSSHLAQEGGVAAQPKEENDHLQECDLGIGSTIVQQLQVEATL